MAVTILKYLLGTQVATSAEIIRLKKENPKDYDILIQWAHEQAKNEGVEIEAPVTRI